MACRRWDPRSASPVQASLARDIFSALGWIVVRSRAANNHLATRSHHFHRRWDGLISFYRPSEEERLGRTDEDEDSPADDRVQGIAEGRV